MSPEEEKHIAAELKKFVALIEPISKKEDRLYIEKDRLFARAEATGIARGGLESVLNARMYNRAVGKPVPRNLMMVYKNALGLG